IYLLKYITVLILRFRSYKLPFIRNMAFDLNDRNFIEKLVHEPVLTFSLKEGSKAGDNIAGDLKSIEIKTKTRDLHLIHKTFPASPVDKDRVRNYRVFWVENQFYSSLKPDFEQLVPSSLDYKIPTAQFYAGMNDNENDYITMEDLRPAGYKMPDKFQGLSFPEVSKVMEVLAKFHAAGYYFLRVKGEGYFDSKYPLFSCNNFFLHDNRSMRPVFIQAIYTSMCDIISELEPEMGAKVSKFAGLSLTDFGTVINEIMDLTDTKMFPTIVHGDLWVNNILVKEVEGQVDVKFVDFQMTRRGNIFDDLVYFMFTSTTAEFRRKYLQEMLSIYYENFAGFLKEVKYELPIGFSRASLIDGFSSLVIPGFVYMTFAIPMQLGIPLAFPEVMEIQKQVMLEDGVVTENVTAFTLEQRARFLREKLRRETKVSPVALKRLVEMAKEVYPFL
ncbi:unnamed protein product, partial [Allacma fusca]